MARGEAPLPPSVTRRVIEEVTRHRRAHQPPPELQRLTGRELAGKLGLRERVHAVIYAYEHGTVEPDG